MATTTVTPISRRIWINGVEIEELDSVTLPGPCHHSNCRRFKCFCGTVVEWQHWKDPHRIRCKCGRWHTRGIDGPTSYRRKTGCRGEG